MFGLAGQGDVTAAQSLPESARAFLAASRAVNMSGPDYVADFRFVQSAVAQVRARFVGQMSIEEQTLTEMQEQSQKLSEQLAGLYDMREAIQAAADRQIALLQQQIDEANTRGAALLEAMMQSGQVQWAGFAEVSTRIQNVETAIVEEGAKTRRVLEAALV
jgi:hypothetical protein